MKIDRDLLITYRLDKARAWYETAPPDAFAGYAGAVNPTYITLSRRAQEDQFISEVPPKTMVQFSARSGSHDNNDPGIVSRMPKQPCSG